MILKILSWVRRCRFIIALLVAFIIADSTLGIFFDSYIIKSGNFWLNDYEITRRAYPEKLWDKVFFGNSAVISSYREDLSSSGYINFGVDYGSMKDMLNILYSGKVKIGSELVLGINWATLFDNMETNSNYYWNRKVLEPYSYFQRDRLYEAFTGKLKSIITGKSWAEGQYRKQTKSYYYSCLTEKQLFDKVYVYKERYWSTGVEGCRKNLAALGQIADYCKKKNIRLRVVMMPWNPVAEKPDVIVSIEKRVNDICKEKQIECLNMTDAFDAECFYDLGHMNYEYGSHVFTEAIDPWLKS
jgi:hypothetical protein